MAPDVLIRDWAPSDDLAALTRLLHEAYAPLAAQGLRFLASHQDEAMTQERLSEGWSFILECDGIVTGTITLRGTDPENECKWYRRPGVYSISQFAVRPDRQRQGLGRRLLFHAESLARERGAGELALDTAEEALDLRTWYSRLGFREVASVSWPETNYRSVVLSKSLHG